MVTQWSVLSFQLLLRTAKYGDTPDQQPQGGSAAPLCGKPSAFRPDRQKTSFLFWAPVAERLSLSAQQAAKPLRSCHYFLQFSVVEILTGSPQLKTDS